MHDMPVACCVGECTAGCSLCSAVCLCPCATLPTPPLCVAVCCCCRQARVSPRTQSPVVATIITGTIIGVLAFFVPLEILADLVSM